MAVDNEKRLRAMKQLRVASIVFSPLGVFMIGLGLFLLSQGAGSWVVVLLLGAVFTFQSFSFRHVIRKTQREIELEGQPRA